MFSSFLHECLCDSLALDGLINAPNIIWKEEYLCCLLLGFITSTFLPFATPGIWVLSLVIYLLVPWKLAITLIHPSIQTFHLGKEYLTYEKDDK